jgi:bacteriocin-like protein
MNKQLETISTTDLSHVTGGIDLGGLMSMIGPLLGGLGGGGGK